MRRRSRAWGGATRSELGSRLAVIIEHLLKLEHSPAVDPRRGWVETVVRERARIDSLLAKSPSLRRELPAMFEDEFRRTKRLTLTLLAHYGEADPAVRAAVRGTDYTLDQVLGDWLPEDAGR